ncbi:MAG: pilus assembly protein PilM [Candidatus Firestonebacteria bacterium]
MAKNTSIGIDIGNSQIKVVQIKKTGNGVKIEKFFVEDYNLSPKELLSPIAVINKRMEIVQKLFKEIKPVNVVVAVAKGEDNLRTISMPIMTEQTLRQALRWGGQPEYIPFDLKEMTWDVVISQMYRRKEEIKADGKEKMDVIIALAKKEIVNSYLDIFESSNAMIDVLDSNVLAGINFTCLNLAIPKDKIWCKIDFGAEMTNVSVLEGGNMKFTLNIHWGVNDIIEAAQSVNGSSSWPEAKDFVRKMDFSIEPSRSVIMQLLEPKLKDFSRQLSAAIGFYESKNPDRQISDVILSGGGAMLPNISGFFSSKINREVKLENELNKSVVGCDKQDEAKIKELLPLLNVAIGAAARNIMEVRNNANLLPFEIMLGRRLANRRTSTVAVIAAILLLMSGLVSMRLNERTKILNEKASIVAELNKIKSEASGLFEMKMSVDTFDKLDGNYNTVKKSLTKWSEVLTEFSTLVPRNTRIDNAVWNVRATQFFGKVNKDKNPQYMQEYQQFVNNLNASKNFSDVKQGSIKESDTTLDFEISKAVLRATRTKPIQNPVKEASNGR